MLSCNRPPRNCPAQQSGRGFIYELFRLRRHLAIEASTGFYNTKEPWRGINCRVQNPFLHRLPVNLHMNCGEQCSPQRLKRCRSRILVSFWPRGCVQSSTTTAVPSRAAESQSSPTHYRARCLGTSIARRPSPHDENYSACHSQTGRIRPYAAFRASQRQPEVEIAWAIEN